MFGLQVLHVPEVKSSCTGVEDQWRCETCLKRLSNSNVIGYRSSATEFWNNTIQWRVGNLLMIGGWRHRHKRQAWRGRTVASYNSLLSSSGRLISPCRRDNEKSIPGKKDDGDGCSPDKGWLSRWCVAIFLSIVKDSWINQESTCLDMVSNL